MGAYNNQNGIAGFGEVVTVAIGTPRVNDRDGTVEIPFMVWPDLATWNVTRDETPPPERIPDMQYESELPTPALPTGLLQVRYPDGAYELRAAFNGVAGGTDAEAVIRTHTEGEPDLWQQMTAYGIGTGARYACRAGNHAGKKAVLRVQLFNDDDEGAYWPPFLSVDPVAIDNSRPNPPALTIGDNEGQGGGYRG